MAKQSLSKYILSRMRTRLRLVIMKDDTFEEKFSLRLTPLNVFILFGSLAILLIFITTYIIAFTPLRQYIPGYADVGMKRKLISLSYSADSLSNKLYAQNLYIQNLNAIINGELPVTKLRDTAAATARYDSISRLEKSEADSLLRYQIESADRFDLAIDPNAPFGSGIANFAFFTPLKGTITSKFNSKQKHFGIDIVAGANEVIKSTLDGTVVFSDFTSETGYTLCIQHSNNLFSVYKHNSALLKHIGDFVKAGDVIAIIGNSGELTTGPHLHFELWYNGSAVDPSEYMMF